MFLRDYPKEELSSIWGKFAEIKNQYTPNERWSEIVDGSYRNASFLDLTLDDALYDFYKNSYSNEDEQTKTPFYVMSWMIILAKKAIIDYNMEQVIYWNEFDTYFRTTRLTSLFERLRDVSEFKDQFGKYETKMVELFPQEEITVYNMFENQEYVESFDELCEDDDFGISFIDTFSNMLVYDFVKNYFHLNNERNLSNIYSNEDKYEEYSERAISSYDGDEDCCDGMCNTIGIGNN